MSEPEPREAPKDDQKAARAELLGASLETLRPEARDALFMLAVPHWLPASALMLAFRPDELIPHLPDLLERGFAKILDDGSLQTPASTREILIDQAVSERREVWIGLSQRLRPVFERLGGDSAEAHIEAQYHRLAFDPDGASAQLFRDVRAWSSEPVFAFAQVERLLGAWREQARRITLSPPARSYLAFGELLDPTQRKSARDELTAMAQMPLPAEDSLFVGEFELRRGLNLTALNRQDEAEPFLRKALDAFGGLRDTRGMSAALRALGRIDIKRNNFGRAEGAYRQARTLTEGGDYPIEQAHAVKAMAEIAYFRGEFSAAADDFESAIQIFQDHGGRTGEANARVAYAQLLLNQQRLEPARQHREHAESIYSAIHNQLGAANCAKLHALELIERRQFDEALRASLWAKAQYADGGWANGQANASLIAARAMIGLGELDPAEGETESARTIFAAADDQFGLALYGRDAGLLAASRGDPSSAADHLRQSAALFYGLGAYVESAISGLILSRFADLSGDFIRSAQGRLAEAHVALSLDLELEQVAAEAQSGWTAA